MLYLWLFPLRNEAEWLHFLNVLRYIPLRVIGATLTALFIAFVLSPWFIRKLQRRQIGQTIRSDGPQSHRSKAGTPTMGGALILLALVIPTILWADVTNPFVWNVLVVTAGYGGIGFVDDMLKIRDRHSAGLLPRYKLILQFAIAGSALGYLFFQTNLPADWLLHRTRVALPFVAYVGTEGLSLPPAVYLALSLVFVVFMSNAVNLTDGLDGLAIGPVIINAGTFLILTYMAGVTLFGFRIAEYLRIPPIASAAELSIPCGAMIGAGMGFLWYNTYPAQVFMGDVGSLSLGGALGMIAVLSKNEIVALLVGGIFVLEAASVITQVASFKMTGRRIFRMAPLHHHYELKGWAEPKVIVRFWIISIMLALMGLATLKLR
jgi:phospho-N-acetylmuramoyl-pentapeptide-transferase